MARSTGPVLALGAITVANSTVLHGRPMDWRVPVATGLAALCFDGLERVWPAGAVALAYTALVAVCLTRIDPSVPSPVESALSWFNGAKQ